MQFGQYGGADGYAQELRRLTAFVARYGHQQMPHILDMDVVEIVLFSQALAELIGQENAPASQG